MSDRLNGTLETHYICIYNNIKTTTFLITLRCLYRVKHQKKNL